jgi:phosphoglycolate phosphatase
VTGSTSRVAPADVAAALGRCDLVVFDKDGTLIDFGAMWGPWAVEVADRLERETGQAIRGPLFDAYGYDEASGATLSGRPLAIASMAEIRDLTVAVLGRLGFRPDAAEEAVTAAWWVPDPETTARPLTEIATLFGRLRERGARVAVATSDDREPTERTIASLGVVDLVDALACADDGLPGKPAPHMVASLCAALGVEPARTAVVGDSPVDLAMGRAAGAGLLVGVLSGVGRRDELEPLADVVVPSVAELLAG